MNINIEGLEKAKLLQGLFNSAKPVGLGFYDPASNKEMSYEEAKNIIDKAKGRLYFDYLNGRKMKINISGDEINSSEYDESSGSGTALMVVTALRKNMEVGFQKATPTNRMEDLASQGKFDEAVAQPQAQIGASFINKF